MADETILRKKFLKREDIRTMEKDIGHLKEDEAKMERERITSLKTGEIKGKLDKKNLEEEKRRFEEERRKAGETKRTQLELERRRLSEEKRRLDELERAGGFERIEEEKT